MRTSYKSRTQENAGLLLAWSIFALVEGTLRMVINSKPGTGDIDYFTNEGGTIVPIAALLAAGVAEVIFGIAGIYLALFSLLFSKNNPTATFIYMIVQAVLGWFVFLTFVIAQPIVAAKEATATELLSETENKSLVILGNMLGSICFCWALQGGQFIMAMRLWQSQKGDSDSKGKNAFRARIWSGNMIVAALSTLYVGSLLQSKSFTSTTGPVPSPPHVVWRPWLSIVTGVIMLVYGVLGYFAATDCFFARTMPVGFVAATTAMMINFSWTFGIVPGLAGPIPGAAQHIGLILSVTILPLFHSHRAHTSVEDEDDFTETSQIRKTQVELEDGSASE